MNTVAGLVALAFGAWLLRLTIIHDWHWSFAALGVPMVIGATVLLLSAFG